MKKFLPNVNVVPAVNQIECNPFCQRKEEREFMVKNKILLQSWYPIGHGNKELLNHSIVTELAEKYGKTNVQVILRWHIQSGFIAIPKSTSLQHINDNFNIFDFEISQEDMQKIEQLDTGKPSFIHNEEFGKQLLSWVVPE